MEIDVSRPNSGGVEGRSSDSYTMGGPRGQPPAPEAPSNHVLKFSIDRILAPDFGKKDLTSLSKDKTKPINGEDRERASKERSSADTLNQDSNLINSSTPWPPIWVHCSRTSSRPSSGPRLRRVKKHRKANEEKRPRTAFSSEQLAKLKQEFASNKYLTENRRKSLSASLNLEETQIKIWFQNRRAKEKRSSPLQNQLTLQLIASGLYNHSTIPIREDDENSS